jgi:hypothetical protein
MYVGIPKLGRRRTLSGRMYTISLSRDILKYFRLASNMHTGHLQARPAIWSTVIRYGFIDQLLSVDGFHVSFMAPD